MSHLSEKTAEFVFGELSASEMAEGKKHVAGCADCRREVELFQRTHSMLRAWPDVETPRRIIFEAEKRPLVWRWLAPSGVAAAVLLAVLVAAPMQVQWQNSQLMIAFGKVQEPAPPAPVLVKEAVAPAIDYEKIIAAVTESQQVWLSSELKNRDTARNREIQQLGAQIEWIQDLQRAAWIETLGNGSAIQQLARNDSQE